MCFILLELTILLLDIADIADYYLASFPTLNAWKYVSSAIGYTLRPTTIAVVLAILFCHQKTSFAL